MLKTPFVSTDQMIEVDRAMIEDYNILLIQMMENAGRNLAHTARTRFLSGDPRGKRVAVLSGKGGNGGGGLVCARRLHNWGSDVSVFITADDAAYAGVPAHQLDVLRRMQVSVDSEGLPGEPAFDLVIDAVIGYSLSGNPRGRAGDLIAWANAQQAPILSLDVPSGIDTTSGQIHTPVIRASATMTLALPKDGLKVEQVRALVGELYLADISVPPQLYGSPALGMDVGPLFAEQDVVRLW